MRRRSRVTGPWLRACAAAGLALAVLAFAGFGCADEPARPMPAPDAPDLVLLTVDTLRADHTSLYGYARETTPALDAFFSEGRVYERAYATSSHTPASIFSIMTGHWPFRHGQRRFMWAAPPSLETLAQRLSAAGYDAGAFVSNYVLKNRHTGLARGFAVYDDELPEKESFRDEFERSAGPTTEAAIAWLAPRRGAERPFFLWVHYIDPHGPYTPPEPKVREFSHDAPRPVPIDTMPEYQRHPGVDDALEYVDLYDEEIAHADAAIGRLLARIEALERARPALFVFTSDHGESLLERERRFEHSHHVYEELLRVPLALRGDGIVPARVDEPVSIADIAPTLLEAAGLGPPEGIDGTPLRAEPPRRTLYAEAYPLYQVWMPVLWRAAIRGDEKWVLAPSAEARADRLASDAAAGIPETLSPLPADGNAPAGLEQLLAWHAQDRKLRRAEQREAARRESAHPPTLDEADRKALEALGYLE